MFDEIIKQIKEYEEITNKLNYTKKEIEQYDILINIIEEMIKEN